MFDQLKPLMQNGERYIVVEGGRPEYVLMRFADYATLAGGRHASPEHRRAAEVRTGEWERAPSSRGIEFDEVGAVEPVLRTAEVEFGAPAVPADPTTIRLEDLPL